MIDRARLDGLQFCTSLWPGVPIPEPKVWRSRVVVQPLPGVDFHFEPQTSVVHFGPTSAKSYQYDSSNREEIYLPPDLAFIEARKVDIHDEDQVLAFVEAHGELWPPWESVHHGADLYGTSAGQTRTEQGDLYSRNVHPVPYQIAGAIHHLCQMGDFLEAWTRNEEQAAELDARSFASTLNTGLRSFTVHVVAFDEATESNKKPPPQVPQPDLFSVACLQLYNILLEGAPLVHCQNETCGETFVYQRDEEGFRSASRARSKGVRFCSRSCGKTQNQRDRRRKLKKGSNA